MTIRNNKGVTLVELAIYAGLSAMVILVALSVTRVSQDMVQSSMTFAGLNEARNRILETLRDETAWKQTLANGANASTFWCLNNQVSCSGAGGTFTLVNSQGVVVSEAARPNSTDGLTKTGAPCSTYSASGNSACPFRFVVSWTARCPKATAFNPNPSCINPSIEFTAALQSGTGTQFKDLNVAAYDIVSVKQNTSATLASTCSKMGGTLQADNSCLMPYTNTQCPPNYYIRGFSNGQPVCQTLTAFRCQKGEVLLGVDSSGIAHCGPGCTASTSSAGSIW
ncbi:MAG TPA: hypothetical protein VF412_01500 [Bdellovibrio sp.]|uniref:hypothetical protein n=1 Tax=Bdellovibrio sp. TaxID=28201 RepID=UPI002EFEDF75